MIRDCSLRLEITLEDGIVKLRRGDTVGGDTVGGDTVGGDTGNNSSDEIFEIFEICITAGDNGGEVQHRNIPLL